MTEPQRTRTIGNSVRPFRLWNANEKMQMRWRYFATVKRAHLGALIETRWAKVGTTIEVYDARNGRLYGQYTRRVDRIDFKE